MTFQFSLVGIAKHRLTAETETISNIPAYKRDNEAVMAQMCERPNANISVTLMYIYNETHALNFNAGYEAT